MQEIYRRCKSKGFTPEHVAEVGVFSPESSNVLQYTLDGIRTTLVEAHPTYAADVERYFANYANVTLHTVAIADAPGRLRLFTRGPSTFAEGIADSPSVVNDRYANSDDDTVTVVCKRFDQIDDGTIDLLSLDIEGSEWFVIKHLVSLPTVISVETHGKAYTNPYLPQIEGYMQAAGYRVWYRDNSDTVYVRPELLPVTKLDRTVLRLESFRLRLRRTKSRAKRALWSVFRR